MADRKSIRNAAWIMICKVLQALVQLIVGMLSARYLGPSGYGLLSYAAALTAFAIPLMQLGLNWSLVREYVRTPEEEGTVLATALALNGISALLCAAGVAIFAALTNRGEGDVIWVCTLYGATLLFQSMENLQYFFQARLLSKYASLAALCGYVAVSGYKLWLLAAEKSIRWFALSHAVEYAVAGGLMILSCRRFRKGKFRVSLPMAKRLLRTGGQYIPASCCTAVINSAAGILLKLLRSQQEAGYYAAALTCSVVLHFVYAALLESLRPGILRLKGRDEARYQHRILALFGGFFYVSLIQCAVFALCAQWIVGFLYGGQYGPAVMVLRLLIWQTPFALLGWVRDLWLLAEEKHHLSRKVHMAGALTNLALNVCLIPRWGAGGAAVAAIATQAVSHLLTCFALKELKPLVPVLRNGLHPKEILQLTKEMIEYDKI